MSIDVIVTGRSIPALIAALDLAEVGMKVHLANDPTGSEPPLQPCPDPEGTVREMLNRVAAPIEGSDAPPEAAVLPRAIAPLPISLRDPAGEWAPISEPNTSGIPASPLDARVIRLIGTKGAMRAYIDRIRPVLTVGKTQVLSVLVKQRMGQAMLAGVVDPLIRARFGVPASEVDVVAAAPGLNEAITRQGSLSTAVLDYADRNLAQETRVEPVGGEHALRAELLRKLALYDVQITAEAVETALWNGDNWEIRFADGSTQRSRALVFDAGRSAIPTPLQRELCPELTVTHTRIHAVAEVGQHLTKHAGVECIEQVAGWSVLSVTTLQGPNTVSLISDVRAGTPAEATIAELQPVLTEAGLQHLADTDWELGVAAAPFATIALREAAEARVDDVIAENPYLLPVGSSLNGDDLGLALERAKPQTMQLRRRLLGLID